MSKLISKQTFSAPAAIHNTTRIFKREIYLGETESKSVITDVYAAFNAYKTVGDLEICTERSVRLWFQCKINSVDALEKAKELWNRIYTPEFECGGLVSMSIEEATYEEWAPSHDEYELEF